MEEEPTMISIFIMKNLKWYTHLDILFFVLFFFGGVKNGNWYRTQKSIAEHASKAMYRFFSIFNQYEFKTEQKLKLFDTLVSSVLNYSSEVWGFHEGKDKEQVHTKCLRKYFVLKNLQTW